MNLAVLNLHVLTMPPIKFQLKLTYDLAGDVVSRISRWPLWQPSRIPEPNEFSNSESLCRPNASHQVWAQSDLAFGSRCSLKIFKMVTMAILVSRTYNFSNSESSCSLDPSHLFSSIPLKVRDVV